MKDVELRPVAARHGFAEIACPDCKRSDTADTACPNCGGSGRLWQDHQGSTVSDEGLARLELASLSNLPRSGRR